MEDGKIAQGNKSQESKEGSKTPVVKITDGLQPEVEKLYELVDLPKACKRDFREFGIIDLRQISVEDAKNLVERDFPHLKLRK
jgi:hypothetical protein